MKGKSSPIGVDETNPFGILAVYRDGNAMWSIPSPLEPDFLSQYPASSLLALCWPVVVVHSVKPSDINAYAPCVLFDVSDEDVYFACDRMHGEIMGAAHAAAIWQDSRAPEPLQLGPAMLKTLAQTLLYEDAIWRLLNRKNGISHRKWTSWKMPLLHDEAARRGLAVCDETTLCFDLFRLRQLNCANYSYSLGKEQPLSERLKRVMISFDPMFRNWDGKS